MTGKERVKAAIACKPVDHVPLGLYAVDPDIVSKVIGRPSLVRNFPELQIAYWQDRRDEIIEAYKIDLVDFYRRIDCADIITYRDAFVVPPKGYDAGPAKKLDDNKWEDKDGRIYKIAPDANEINGVILGPSQSIPMGTKYENFMAMIDEHSKLC